MRRRTRNNPGLEEGKTGDQESSDEEMRIILRRFFPSEESDVKS